MKHFVVFVLGILVCSAIDMSTFDALETPVLQQLNMTQSIIDVLLANRTGWNRNMTKKKKGIKLPYCMDKNATCVIQNVTLQFQQEDLVIDTGGYDLQIIDSTLSQMDAVGLNSTIRIYALKNESSDVEPSITLTNSTLRFQLIYLHSHKQITVDQDSKLDANGTGDVEGLGFNKDVKSSKINGGSFGGQGGNCEDVFFQKTYGSYKQTMTVDPAQNVTWDNLQNFIGSGGGVDSQSVAEYRGGGSIVTRSRLFNFFGHVDASGYPSSSENLPTDKTISGGSGGYIFIDKIDDPDSTDNKTSLFTNLIHANGGFGSGDGDGGSGGRIVINLNQSDSLVQDLVQALGGINTKYQTSLQYCLNGAAGSIFYPASSSLFFTGYDGVKTPMKTPFETFVENPEQNPKFLTVSKMVNLAPIAYEKENQHFSAIIAGNINIRNGAYITTPISQKENLKTSVHCDQMNFEQGYFTMTQSLDNNHDLFINCTTLVMVQQSNLNLGAIRDITINGTNFTMESGSTVNFGKSLKIYSNAVSLANVQASNDDQAHFNSSTLAVIANQSILTLQGNQISVNYVSLVSRSQLKVSGSIWPQRDDFSKCIQEEKTQKFFSFIDPAYTDGQSKMNETQLLQNMFNFNPSSVGLNRLNLNLMPAFLMSNYTVSLLALDDITIDDSALVFSPRVGIYGNDVYLNGVINASGKGCQSDQGIGKGPIANSSTCAGGGGAHAGNGGIAIPLNDSLIQADCNKFFSKHYGDYDGMFLYEGSGGGSLQFSGTGGAGGGIIYIEGNTLKLHGKISSDGFNSNEQSSGGGGAGGTIFLGTYFLTGKASFSVKGGSATNQGGAGSGGRILMYRFNWTSPSFFEYDKGTNAFNQESGGGQSQQNDGQKGTVWSTPCPMGFAGFTCYKCKVGTYSNNIFGTACSTCRNMLADPANGQYQNPDPNVPWKNSNCPYICNYGFTDVAENPYCVQNFELFLQNIGGQSMFIVIVAATSLMILFMIYYIFQKRNNKYQTIEKLIERGDRVIKDPSSECVASIETDGTNESNSNHDGNVIQQIQQKNLQFFDRDIFMHFSRLYFLGNNTFDQPWKLPTTPPASLKQRLILERYVEFANQLNKRTEWSKWERFVENLLSVLYPPLAPKFLFWRRMKHCNRFIQALSEKMQQVQFWKSEEERMRDYIQIKFSFSNKMQLGYLDFLDQRYDHHQYEGAKFPLTLFLSGVGSFNNPFYLDYENDPIVKSIGKNCGQKTWKKFSENLNSKLWSLQIFSFNYTLRNTIFDILNFIEILNNKIFSQCGFEVSLWVVELKLRYVNDYVDFRSGSEYELFCKTEINESPFKFNLDYLKKKPQSFNNFLNYWKHMTKFDWKTEFKLALVLKNIEMKNDNFNDSVMLAKSSMRNNRKSDLSIDSGRYNNTNRVSETPDQTATRRMLIDSIGYKEGQKEYGTANENIQWVIKHMREDQLDKEWLKSFKIIEPLESFGDKIQHYRKAFQLFLHGCSHILTFKHSIPVRGYYSIASMLAYQIFVILDVVFTIQLLIPHNSSDSIYFDLNKLLFLFCFPLASLMSPLTGFIAMISCKTNFYQMHAFYNHLSLLTNCLVYLVCIIIAHELQFQFVIVIMLILSKIVLAYLLPIQISYFNNPKYDKNMEYLEDQFEYASSTEQTLVRTRKKGSKKIRVRNLNTEPGSIDPIQYGSNGFPDYEVVNNLDTISDQSQRGPRTNQSSQRENYFHHETNESTSNRFSTDQKKKLLSFSKNKPLFRPRMDSNERFNFNTSESNGEQQLFHDSEGGSEQFRFN